MVFAVAVDDFGNGWETGRLADSRPGEPPAVATVVTRLDPLPEVDLGGGEPTSDGRIRSCPRASRC